MASMALRAGSALLRTSEGSGEPWAPSGGPDAGTSRCWSVISRPSVAYRGPFVSRSGGPTGTDDPRPETYHLTDRLARAAGRQIVTGGFQVVAAISLRREIEGELFMALGGVLSIVFGLLLVINPGAGLLSLTWLVGLWALIFGIANLVFGWRLRELHQRTTGLHDGAGAH
jgi:hypothetical protein